MKKKHNSYDPDDNEMYCEYLDELRESGITNMFGALPYLRKSYPELDREHAKSILLNWMKTFGKRHSK